MHLRLSFLFIFLFSITLSAQKRKKEIDSLETLLKTELQDEQKLRAYKKLFTRVYIHDPAYGKVCLDSFQQIANRLGPERHMGALHSYSASYYQSISDFPSALQSFKDAIDSYEKVGNERKRARALARLGSTQSKLGQYENAMKSMLASVKILESLGLDDDNSLGRTYGQIGHLQKNLRNYQLSNDYYLKAEAEFIRIKNEKDLAYTRGSIGQNMTNLEEYENGIAYLNQAISYFKKEQLPVTISQLYNKLGVLHIARDSTALAKRYFEDALKISDSLNKKLEIAASLGNLGNAYYKEGNYSQALQYYNRALPIHLEASDITALREHYKNLSRTYAEIGDYKKAFEYKRKHFNLHDSIFKEEGMRNMQNLEIQYETEKKEAAIKLQGQEIETLNEKVKVSNLKKTLYSIGMLAFILIAGLLYFGLTQRIKKNRIAREKKEAMLQQEIAFKKKELASQTLHLVQKSTFIEELKNNLERIKASPELFKIEMRRLILLLKKESVEDKDWEVFKSYFSEVHNNFDNKLKAIYADISEKEIRLASFLRMNLSTKEIASILNVLPDSVLKSKYRLKKKLNLDKDEDLNVFLSNL